MEKSTENVQNISFPVEPAFGVATVATAASPPSEEKVFDEREGTVPVRECFF